MNIILKAKHWQIFLMFVILFIFGINNDHNSNLKNEALRDDNLIYILINTLSIILYIFINTSILDSMLKYLGKKHLSNKYLLNIFFYIHIIVILGFVSLGTIFKEYGNSRSSEWIVWLLFLPYVAIVITNYIIAGITFANFLSKVENKSINPILYTLAFIFYPIGVWFIQPKVNLYYDILKESDNTTDINNVKNPEPISNTHE